MGWLIVSEQSEPHGPIFFRPRVSCLTTEPRYLASGEGAGGVVEDFGRSDNVAGVDWVGAALVSLITIVTATSTCASPPQSVSILAQKCRRLQSSFP